MAAPRTPLLTFEISVALGSSVAISGLQFSTKSSIAGRNTMLDLATRAGVVDLGPNGQEYSAKLKNMAQVQHTGTDYTLATSFLPFRRAQPSVD